MNTRMSLLEHLSPHYDLSSMFSCELEGRVFRIKLIKPEIKLSRQQLIFSSLFLEPVTPIGVREVRFRPARIINWKWDIGHTEYITSNRIDSLTHWLNVTCADLTDPDVEITDDDMKLSHDIINLVNLTHHKKTSVPKLISFD